MTDIERLELSYLRRDIEMETPAPLRLTLRPDGSYELRVTLSPTVFSVLRERSIVEKDVIESTGTWEIKGATLNLHIEKIEGRDLPHPFKYDFEIDGDHILITAAPFGAGSNGDPRYFRPLACFWETPVPVKLISRTRPY